jgi:hypothetical protein
MLKDQLPACPAYPHVGRARFVIIVSRDQSDLWRHLQETFAGVDEIEIVLERRHGGWWQWTQSRQYQERGADRRRPPVAEADFRDRAFQVVPRDLPR